HSYKRNVRDSRRAHYGICTVVKETSIVAASISKHAAPRSYIRQSGASVIAVSPNLKVAHLSFTE
ncbi:MAG: hypothetical protein OXC68_06960, partial [Aestuariivita sp.]|nr:hypothetical protein [Aestuariivita sp.]